MKPNESPQGSYTATGSLDAQSRLLAKKLHESGYIYALYGALDGLSLSYSMVKYSFDLLYTNTDIESSDVIHDWMATPGGALISTAESITLIGFSWLANVFDDNDKNVFKRYIATLWPYFRDTMKGMKNAYKGIRSTVQVASLFAGLDLRYMIVPTGILLGILSALNRIWMRSMRNQRKAMMKTNAELLLEIHSSEHLDTIQCAALSARIGRQSTATRRISFLAAAYGGVIDGLYLYMGAMSLAVFASPIFIAMSVFCVIFTLTCIMTRIYEEYDFQRKLVASQAKIELAICGKELETLFDNLQKISDPLITPSYDSLQNDQERMLDALEHKIQEFRGRRHYLRSQLNLSYTSATLAGLKDGLAAYGAIASVMFATATIYAMFLTPFPPAFVVVAVLSGVACLIGFVAHALSKNYTHLRAQEEKISKPHELLFDWLQTIKKNKQDIQNIKPEQVKEAVLGGMVVDASPQFFFQEWFEVARSFFSGISKGQKSVDYTLNAWQERDEEGHYHDTPIMCGFTALNSTVFAIALALRAHARGFGRAPLDEVTPGKKTTSDSLSPPSSPCMTSSSTSDSRFRFFNCRTTSASNLPSSKFRPKLLQNARF